MSETATTWAAREHARAQAGTVVDRDADAAGQRVAGPPPEVAAPS